MSGYRLAIFASDKGPGDAGRASTMSEVGAYLARKGATLLCPVFDSALSMPLIKSARTVGGTVRVLASTDFTALPALGDIEIERFNDDAHMRKVLIEQSDAFIGLPGSLASVTQLFNAWVESGSVKPVALLNRNKAYELMRGMVVDVFVHSARDWEKKLVVAETTDELWAKLSRILANA